MRTAAASEESKKLSLGEAAELGYHKLELSGHQHELELSLSGFESQSPTSLLLSKIILTIFTSTKVISLIVRGWGAFLIQMIVLQIYANYNALLRKKSNGQHYLLSIRGGILC